MFERLASLADPLLVVFFTTLVGAIILAGEVWRRVGGAPGTATRKLVHVGVGLLVLPVALTFRSTAWALVLPSASILLTFVSYRYRLVAAIEEEGHGSPGTIYFPISVALLTLLFWPIDARAAMVAGLYAMAVGDAAASVLGRRWGRHHYRVAGGRKSWEGTAAMFLGSFLAILLGTQPLLGGWAPLAAAGAALVATGAEAPAGRGLDNLTVPISAALSFWLLNGALG